MNTRELESMSTASAVLKADAPECPINAIAIAVLNAMIYGYSNRKELSLSVNLALARSGVNPPVIVTIS